VATPSRTASYALGLLFSLVFPAGVAFAQEQPERPYFVTYDDHVEKRGELELSLVTTTGDVRNEATRYYAPWMELEYGVTSWWTSELYIEGASFVGDGSAFTGWRLENRFRPLKGDHLLNPVLYVEFEDVNDASRIQTEVVGRGPLPFAPIGDLTEGRNRELEGRLILSSSFGRWNVSENLVVEKNLSEEEGVEFGYTVGVARSFGSGLETCRFCPSAFIASVEAYGGLGTTASDATGSLQQYIAPVFSWHVTPGSLFRASIGFGLTSASDRYLVRVGYSFELDFK
jgi:hypothetical protein